MNQQCSHPGADVPQQGDTAATPPKGEGPAAVPVALTALLLLWNLALSTPLEDRLAGDTGPDSETRVQLTAVPARLPALQRDR